MPAEEIEKKIGNLVGIVENLGEELMHDAAQNSGLLCAIAALIETHPDQKAFVASFRSYWKVLAVPHLNVRADGAEQQGLEAVLEVIEQACKVPLQVR